MEYNLYLDVFLLLNFIMNVSVLLSLTWLTGRRVKWKNIFAAAVCGAVFNGILILDGWEGYGPAVLTGMLMAKYGLGLENCREMICYGAFLWMLAVSVEGAVRWSGSCAGIFPVPVLSYLIGRERKRQQIEMEVELWFKGRKKTMKGFYDSGNRLAEPVTGKMVHLACYEEIREMLPPEYQETVQFYFETGTLESTKVSKLQMYEFTFLSYHSIGKETGQILGIRMDRAVFRDRIGQKTEERPVIGLVRQKLFVRRPGMVIVNGRLEI